MTKPLVSIFCITYNHEAFISQTIESFLMQQTNFDFDINIGEDCSTDSTATIVKEYALKYPEKIKARCNEVNMGMRANSIKTLQECTGKYIALCEGDDYWTDPHKLQKQVDFLEANLDFAICFHQPKIWNEQEKRFYDYEFVSAIPETTDIHDLAGGNYVPTQTVMYRKNDTAIHDLSSIKTSMTDYPLAMFHAKYGKIMKLPDTMAVYRVHKGGCYQRWNFSNLPQSLSMLEEMFQFFEPDVVSELHFHYEKIANYMLDYYLNLNDYSSAKELLNRFLKIDSELSLHLLFYKIEKLQTEITSIKKSKYYALYNIMNKPFNFLKKNK